MSLKQKNEGLTIVRTDRKQMLILLREVSARKVKELRIRHNLIQKEVAAKLEISIGTYQSYEEARATAPIVILFKLKQLYKLKNIEDLLTEK